MSHELRTCPITGRTVLLHAGWLDAPAPARPPDVPCALCVSRLPAVIARFGDLVAAPHHRGPALAIERDPAARAGADGVLREAFGAHEDVFGPHDAEDAALVRAVAARVNDLRGDRRLRGFRATRRWSPGAHAAWQVLATPWDFAPDPLAAWRAREREAGTRMIEDGPAFAAFAWAPRTPFEAWVAPAAGDAPFGVEDPGPVAAAAARVRARVAAALGAPVVDLVVVDGHPWRIEVVPRLRGPDSVEAAIGVPTHGATPEAASEFLRANPREGR